MGVTLNPKEELFYYGLAHCFDELKQYQKAIFNYSRALELDPEDPATPYNIAIIYKNGLNDYKKALEYFDKAIEIDSTYVLGYYNRADLYNYNLKEYEKANDNYLRALELEPENNLSYIVFNFSLKKYKKVIELCNKAIEIDLKDPQADYYSALVYLEQKNDFRALNSLSQSIKKIKNYSEEGYYISDLDLSLLDLSKVFVLRAELYEKFGENELMCEDLNDAMKYVIDEVLKKEIQKSILEKCKQ